VADSQASNQPLPDDVWEAARFIWENTASISDRELVDYLTTHFGDDAPKTNSAVSKRRRKEEWDKIKLVSSKKTGTKKGKKQEPSEEPSPKNGNQKAQKNEVVPAKTNKAQNDDKSGTKAPVNDAIEQITNSVVMGVKDRAAIIVKTRKRWRLVGEIADQTTILSLGLVDMANDSDADPEEIQKTLVLTSALSNTLDTLTRSLKTISEVELPLCGITPEDFSQSDQDRRLGALEALGDIDGQEREARDRLKAELDDRLEWIKETASSGDFGRTPELDDDDDIEEIDYTQVDD